MVEPINQPQIYGALPVPSKAEKLIPPKCGGIQTLNASFTGIRKFTLTLSEILEAFKNLLNTFKA